MNKLPITLLLILTCTSLSAEIKVESDSSFRRTVTHWFSAWELVWLDIYGIKDIKPVDFVLFDDEFVYSTSDVFTPEDNYELETNLLNLHLKWKKKAHEGTLILPDGSSAPVGMMCFAAENEHTGKPYFVMPLTTFWKNLGVDSHGVALEDMVTGVFLHEFSHTQQMDNFGAWITEFVNQNKIGDDFDDNFIQHTFQNDSVFVKSYNQEVDYFYQAIADENRIDMEKVKMGFKFIKDRRNLLFQNSYENLSAVEDVFLTMEGLGQYTMYVWLTHEKGGDIRRDTAIEGVRRSKKVWSQDQGFLLFLILEELTEPATWASDMFGSDLVYVTTLLKQRLN